MASAMASLGAGGGAAHAAATPPHESAPATLLATNRFG
jgi:hypothetical protein